MASCGDASAPGDRGAGTVLKEPASPPLDANTAAAPSPLVAPGAPLAQASADVSPQRAALARARAEERERMTNELERLGLDGSPEFREGLAQIARRASDEEARLVRRTLTDHYLAAAEISEEQVVEQYQAMQSQLRTVLFDLRVIRVEDEATAQQAAHRLETGESFEALAAELNRDPGLAAAQGRLGPMTRESLPAWLSGYATRVREPGDTAGPFRVPGGWILLQLVDVDRAHVPPIDAVRPRIEAAVRAEAAQQAMRSALYGPDSRD